LKFLNQNFLKNLFGFSSVDDIDISIAGNHENPLPDAIVGPTVACILVSVTLNQNN
jgi:hypothetical protein